DLSRPTSAIANRGLIGYRRLRGRCGWGNDDGLGLSRALLICTRFHRLVIRFRPLSTLRGSTSDDLRLPTSNDRSGSRVLGETLEAPELGGHRLLEHLCSASAPSQIIASLCPINEWFIVMSRVNGPPDILRMDG
ncbi:hypothetical protein PENTCL1PPCAC_28850, partial [Pristionchus entomophagus]